MAYTTIEDPALIKKAFEMKQSGMYVSDIAKLLSEESGKRITQMALWRLFTNDEKTRRQGQIKPDGTKAVPKPTCPKCSKIMVRVSFRGDKSQGRAYIPAGWMCPSKACDYIIKDFVELEDMEEEQED